ncbi:MAG: DNA polymerase II [Cellvibrionaceae bacterium]|nr:DNA polymerase II [Cellvibrionaceae bacterium]
MFEGFILTREWKDAPKGVRLELWVATDRGPLKVSIDRQQAVFFIAATDAERARELLGVTWRLAEVPLRSWHNQALMACYNRSQKRLRDGLRTLTSHGIRAWEGDIRPPERYLMERFIFAGIAFDSSPERDNNSPERDNNSLERGDNSPERGNNSPERGIKNPGPAGGFAQLQQPRCKPSNYKPTLKAISLDIETSMDARQLYSIAVDGDCEPSVFMVRPPRFTHSPESLQHQGRELNLYWYESEADCIRAFLQWLASADPDVLMGWNLVQFDLWVLEQMCRRWRLRFSLGRAGQEPSWRRAGQGDHNFITIPGRVALDGIELLKAAFYNFESFALGNVARELLGKGKLIEGQHRGEEITAQYLERPLDLARYNVQDCELVWEIFAQTHLLDFAIARSQLTGLAMDKIGGSVAAFEYAYLPLLHRAGYVAPNLGELQSAVVAPGGYVMDSKPGLYRQVLVLDFKSLYPSIIRSFKIDPCAYWVAEHQQLAEADCVPGFNEARFAREHSLLPQIIAELWQAREVAKRNDNQPLSQAIKIIMNSFYGVLGSPGCRFFDPRVCSSITLRGHEILIDSKTWIEQQGWDVIYGDTDSVFVHLPDTDCNDKAQAIGRKLAGGLNNYWQQRLATELNLKSYLEIEFETHFSQFFMPTIRGSEQGSKKRYAGLVVDGDKEQLVFKGLENVRTDWTLLARNFQEELYRRIFYGQPYRDFIQALVRSVLAGERDAELVYRKRLRRPLAQYLHNIPPHAQAAQKLHGAGGETLGQGDWVSYLLTVNGPEPLVWQQQNKLSPIDYGLYVERQLKPVADAILPMAGDAFDDIAASQMRLFS